MKKDACPLKMLLTLIYVSVKMTGKPNILSRQMVISAGHCQLTGRYLMANLSEQTLKQCNPL